MTYATEFPDFDADGAAKIDSLVATGAWSDTSWHNDSCPSVTCDVVVVFVDFADEALREYEGCTRFSIRCEDDEVLATDDWADVLAYINDGKRDFSPAWTVGAEVEICSYRMGSTVVEVDGPFAILQGASGSFFLAHGNPDEFCFPCEGDAEECETLAAAQAQLAAEKARP